MRYLLISIIILLSCNSNSKKQNSDNLSFDEYVKQLPTLNLPFVYSTNSGIITKLPVLDESLLSKYTKFWNNKTIGKILDGSDYDILVETEIGDFGPVPLFLTYDNQGIKINTFNAYRTSGDDMGYRSSEYITVDKNMNITVIDSTFTWKLNADETNIIEDSDSLSIGKTIYKLDNKGLFRKQ